MTKSSLISFKKGFYMKQKICILFSTLLLLTSFTACTNRNEESSTEESEFSSEVIPDDEPDISQDIPDDDIFDSEDMEYSLDDYVNSVKDVYGDDYSPDTEIDETEIYQIFGIDDSMYEEIWAEKSSVTSNPDLFIAVKAKDGEAVNVEAQLLNYKQNMMNNSDYEESFDKIDASQVYSNGDYVFLVMVGANEFVDTGEDVETGFKDEIQKGVDALEDMFK